jgi:hypothetical protein
VAWSWARLPAGRVVRLDGPAAQALELILDPPPPGAPAVVTYRVAAIRSTLDLVEEILRELEQVAVEVFPAWLPEAAGITAPGGAGVAALRSLALRRGTSTGHFGPFLADLAEQALRRSGRRSRFPVEVRAAGLARVLTAAFGRDSTALRLHATATLCPGGEERLVAAAEWLAQHAGLGVWLTGADLTGVDRVPTVTIPVPSDLLPSDLLPVVPGSDDLLPAGRWPSGPRPAVRATYPAVAGRPHPASTTELALEVALTACPWAVGRVWNQTYQSLTLTNPIRVDLCWPA